MDYTNLSNKELLKGIQQYEKILSESKGRTDKVAYAKLQSELLALCHEAYQREVATVVSAYPLVDPVLKAKVVK